jgi:hypothetical protein
VFLWRAIGDEEAGGSRAAAERLGVSVLLEKAGAELPHSKEQPAGGLADLKFGHYMKRTPRENPS